MTVNGQSYAVPDGQELVIRTGGGADHIDVPEGTDVDVTVIGGEGNDTVVARGGDDIVLGMDGEDKIDAGGGADRVSGGADADYLDGQGGDDVVVGGSGRDTLYGMDGDDVLAGGEGQDYLEGAEGDDRLDGGEGDDILSGGKGDDTIQGGAGDDVSYSGRGEDTTYAGSGDDTSHVEAGDASYDTEKRVTVEIPDTGASSRSRAARTSSPVCRPTWRCCAGRRRVSRCWRTCRRTTTTGVPGLQQGDADDPGVRHS